MTDFKNEIVRFNEPKGREFFPDTFSNEIYFSHVKDFHVFKYTSNFSIKYVIKGYENYKVGGRNFTIKDRQYLLVNDQQEVWCKQAEAKAISIFLNKEVVCNVLDTMLYSSEQLLENPFAREKKEINFFENLYSNQDALGEFLTYFECVQARQKNFNINEELFYVLAERLLWAQIEVRKSIDQLDSVKYSTRSELYRRATIARNYIEDHIYDSFNLDILSRFSGLSKYHLLRTFKAIYHTTPYNYYLRLKVKRSEAMLRDSSLSITHIAEISGFNDIHSYSKRFKALNGLTPTAFRKSSL
ncbi:MAG: AraC family transcriptional regulator [Bacteroidota bacterium]